MSQQRTYVNLMPGDPAPWFIQRATGNPRYAFDTAAGRYLVLCFYASSTAPLAREALEAVAAHRHLFDDDRACFFGVTMDPADEAEERVKASIPGIRHFFDSDGTIAKLYGALPRDAEPGAPSPARRFWAVLDPTMRVLKVVPFAADGSDATDVFAFLESLPPPSRYAGENMHAPVLLLPNVFEPELCERLIGEYERAGGRDSGFMRQIDGKTVMVQDASHKRRKDHEIEDDGLKRQLQARIQRRIVPQILKAHQFQVTRMERYIVGCYAAEDGAHFRPHRDNTTAGTAHRRFAVSINLNSDFDGGEVSFPEYGTRAFKPQPGGAVVFSCSFLHAVSKVTAGKRYAFLPFLYDDAAARLRAENSKHLAEGVPAYKLDEKATAH